MQKETTTKAQRNTEYDEQRLKARQVETTCKFDLKKELHIQMQGKMLYA